jgi:transposase
MDQSKIIYIDETSIDSRISRSHARSPRGKRARCQVNGNRGKRHTIVGGLLQNKLISALRIEGSCNREVFMAWIKEGLLPLLQKGMTIVMDNVAFHKSKEIAKLIESKFVDILFLPPYSPDFNPIEHTWAQRKARVKSLVTFQKNKSIEQVIDIVFSTN